MHILFSKKTKQIQVRNLPSVDVIALSVGLDHRVQLVLRHGVGRGLGVLGEHLVQLGRNEPAIRAILEVLEQEHLVVHHTLQIAMTSNQR